jgi:hypothetical protein
MYPIHGEFRSIMLARKSRNDGIQRSFGDIKIELCKKKEKKKASTVRYTIFTRKGLLHFSDYRARINANSSIYIPNTNFVQYRLS